MDESRGCGVASRMDDLSWASLSFGISSSFVMLFLLIISLILFLSALIWLMI